MSLTDEAKHARRPKETAPEDMAELLERIHPFTMVGIESLTDLARQVQSVLTTKIPGDLVECGVWRGGASFLMAEILKRAGVSNRKVWLFDSYEGLPAPDQIDGEFAAQVADHPDLHYDNNAVSLEEVQRNAETLGLGSYTQCVKGWFDRALPVARGRIGPIAILRIDCDWYSSVRCCLDNLYDLVSNDGFIIIANYYGFDGVALAVHDFLAERRLPHRIESVMRVSDGGQFLESVVFRKGITTWNGSWSWANSAAREIATVIPAGETFILADQDELRNELGKDRHIIPFLERDGQYWGCPEDDETAIREIQRLRGAGARFVVFAWPAFWWLDYYSGLSRYLSSKFPCLLRNQRLAIFDLMTEEQA